MPISNGKGKLVYVEVDCSNNNEILFNMMEGNDRQKLRLVNSLIDSL